MMNLDGTDKTEILCNTSSFVPKWNFAWSPDDTKIAYQSSSCEKYTMDELCGLYIVEIVGNRCEYIVDMNVGIFSWRPIH